VKFEIKHKLAEHNRWLDKNGFVNRRLWNGEYWVSDSGEIASIFDNNKNFRSTPIKMKPRYLSNRYRIFKFKGRNYLAHRVVAELFIGTVSGLVVHHKDGVRDNNNVTNLEITNLSTNNKYGAMTRKKTSEHIKRQFIAMCVEHAATITKE
jgi:ligand-binding sensor domain-containing protein